VTGEGRQGGRGAGSGPADRPLVLGVAGSARKHGNSATLLAAVLDELAGEVRTETVFLADCDIRPCTGCHYCETHGSCRLEDDMSGLHRRLLAAEVILLASPAYMGGLCSRVQAFMERTWPLRKGRMAGKAGSYVVAGRRRIGAAISLAEEFFTRLRMTKLPGVLGYAFEPGRIAADAEAMTGARRLADEIRAHLRLGPARPRAGDGKERTPNG